MQFARQQYPSYGVDFKIAPSYRPICNTASNFHDKSFLSWSLQTDTKNLTEGLGPWNTETRNMGHQCETWDPEFSLCKRKMFKFIPCRHAYIQTCLIEYKAIIIFQQKLRLGKASYSSNKHLWWPSKKFIFYNIIFIQQMK